MTDKPFFTPPLTIAKKIADITIMRDTDGNWHCTIEQDNGYSVSWRTKPGVAPGVLLNKAIAWATGRGLDIAFITADITKQVPNE